MNNKVPVSEEELKAMFDENFERLRAEGGHSLSPDVKEAAWQQVKLYWKKLRHIAEEVTETEVRLNLPNQRTPKGRPFCIEGVVDVVREDEKVTIYDIKTHDVQFVRNNIELYEGQLNVYAHVWQNLHKQKLDETAIIATKLPDHVMDAVRTGHPDLLATACERWNPVVSTHVNPKKVNETVREFGRVVDNIEEHRFEAPSLPALNKRDGSKGTFATRVCRNCDARFSCDSYRQYAKKYRDRKWTKLAAFYDMSPDEGEQIDRELASMNGAEAASTASKRL